MCVFGVFVLGRQVCWVLFPSAFLGIVSYDDRLGAGLQASSPHDG